MEKQWTSRWLAVLLLAVSYAAAPAQAAESANLAAMHAAKAKLQCKSCHVEGDPKSVTPEVSFASVNKRCVACHGDMEKLAKVTAPKLSNRYLNPHASHLVAIDCATCHSGHAQAAESYCLKCHAFDMPMPGMPAAAKR